VAEFSVRDAQPGDAGAILHVRTRTWQAAYAHILPREKLEAMSAEPWAERWTEWWRGVIEDPAPGAHTLVVDDAGGVAGFASLGSMSGEQDEPGRIGELYAIYVLPEASGRGIGQALMAEVLNRLRSEGFPEAILWVLEDNPRTRCFYELAGWQADGASKDEEWLGTLVREIRYRIALDPAT